MQYKTREEWLEAAVAALAPRIEKFWPDWQHPRVSVGFAPRTGKAIGWCFPRISAADGRPQIFISPVLSQEASPQGVLSTLLHEMCHAALPDNAGHGKAFGRLADAVGLLPPWTATSAGVPLEMELIALAKALGPYPHSEITLEASKKRDTNRWLKIECPGCHCIARVTKKTLDSPGAPYCACQHPDVVQMEEEESEDDAE